MSALHDDILTQEILTWKAMQTSGSALLPFLTADCIMQFPLGMKLTASTSPSLTDILRSPAFAPWKGFLLDMVDVQPIGPDGAVISYRANATRPSSGVPGDDQPEDVKFEALCVSVWRREGEGWKMCFHQQTMAK